MILAFGILLGRDEMWPENERGDAEGDPEEGPADMRRRLLPSSYGKAINDGGASVDTTRPWKNSSARSRSSAGGWGCRIGSPRSSLLRLRGNPFGSELWEMTQAGEVAAPWETADGQRWLEALNPWGQAMRLIHGTLQLETKQAPAGDQGRRMHWW